MLWIDLSNNIMGLTENICFGLHKQNWNCPKVSFFKNYQLFSAKITAGDGDCSTSCGKISGFGRHKHGWKLS